MLAPSPACSLNHNSAPGGIPYPDSIRLDTALVAGRVGKGPFPRSLLFYRNWYGANVSPLDQQPFCFGLKVGHEQRVDRRVVQ